MAYANTQDALDALANVNATQSDLITFVRSLSVDAPGTTTVLYSGDILFPGDQSPIPSWKIVATMGSDVRRMDQTMAAAVISSDQFRAKVAAAFGETPTVEAYNLLPDSHPAKIWMQKGGSGPFVNTPVKWTIQN